jgi:hypothetical protein
LEILQIAFPKQKCYFSEHVQGWLVFYPGSLQAPVILFERNVPVYCLFANIFIVIGTVVYLEDLMLPRQVLYHLSHDSNPKYVCEFIYFIFREHSSWK